MLAIVREWEAELLHQPPPRRRRCLCAHAGTGDHVALGPGAGEPADVLGGSTSRYASHQSSNAGPPGQRAQGGGSWKLSKPDNEDTPVLTIEDSVPDALAYCKDFTALQYQREYELEEQRARDARPRSRRRGCASPWRGALWN